MDSYKQPYHSSTTNAIAIWWSRCQGTVHGNFAVLGHTFYGQIATHFIVVGQTQGDISGILCENILKV